MTEIRVQCANCKRDITESPSYMNREHLRGFCVPGKLHYDEYLTESCEEGRHENCGGSPVFRWHNQSWGTYGIQVCPCQCHREQLGRLVREQWVRWATEHPEPKPSWLLSYEQLSESDKEADRRIGEELLKTFLKWVQGS